jgi:uncharacterized protein
MRILLDTNVIISAVLWGGTPRSLMDVVERDIGATLYSSSVLIEELADVLTRCFAIERLDILGKKAKEVLVDYRESVELVEPIYVPRVVVHDADDDHVLAAALLARVDWIVSGDKHLLLLGSYQGIDIINAAETLRRISGELS